MDEDDVDDPEYVQNREVGEESLVPESLFLHKRSLILPLIFLWSCIVASVRGEAVDQILVWVGAVVVLDPALVRSLLVISDEVTVVG